MIRALRRAALGALALATVALPAGAQDAQAILRRVEQSYRALSSYTQTIGTTATTRVGKVNRTQGFQSRLKYVRPNRMLLTITTPAAGTVTVACDGKQIILHRSLTGQFVRRAAAPDLAGVLKSLGRLGIGSEMDPLYFLANPSAVRRLMSAKIVGSRAIAGQPCQLVRAKWVSTSLLRGKTGTITLAVEKATGLVRRVEMEFRGVPVTIVERDTRGAKPAVTRRKGTLTRTVTITAQEVKANPRLSERDLRFSPPPGSVEARPAPGARP
ncbi:MAG: DUF2092 domain-containing protein [Chthonomonadales bacterium]|nr:DUF2092 domain-containing protein [Chthonomonadales bacterium]